MGWCSGSIIAEELWKEIEPHLPEEKKYPIAKKIYDVFSDNDADCWDYSEGSLSALADPESAEELKRYMTD